MPPFLIHSFEEVSALNFACDIITLTPRKQRKKRYGNWLIGLITYPMESTPFWTIHFLQVNRLKIIWSCKKVDVMSLPIYK